MDEIVISCPHGSHRFPSNDAPAAPHTRTPHRLLSPGTMSVRIAYAFFSSVSHAIAFREGKLAVPPSLGDFRYARHAENAQ